MEKVSDIDASNGVGIVKIQTPTQVNTNNIIKKVLFVDIPQIMGFNEGSIRPDFVQLSQNLWSEFDDIRAYVGFQKWEQLPQGTRVFPSIYQTLSYSGIPPTITMSDPDPIIATEIVKIAYREGNRILIGLLTGDQGYYNALAEAKKAGSIIKVILPSKNGLLSLKTIADEISYVSDYASGYNKRQYISSQIYHRTPKEKLLTKEPAPPNKIPFHIRMGGV